jgi:hypothetical protein
MKSSGLVILFLWVMAASALAQSSSIGPKPNPSQKADLEMKAILNLRKFAAGESVYAMSHPQEGFACDPKILTKLEWPDSLNHTKLLDPALLSGAGQYKFSAQCEGDSKPAGTLNIFAVPLNAKTGLRTFCSTGTFGAFSAKPYVRTSEFPIRSISGGAGESCIAAGEPLK